MKKKMVKSGIFIAVFISAISMSLTVFAAMEGRRGGIQSVGAIDFKDKTVYLAAQDLYYLADQIDLLESTYKTGIVDALGSIGTYFKKDGSIVRDRTANEVHSQEDKKMLSIKNILNAIGTSQSVASLSQTQAVDQNSNPLYYENETAKNQNNLISTTTADTGYPVYYGEAIAKNLSAGTAAWVNGTLVKGNGGDNAAYYARGVAFADGRSNTNSVSYQEGYNAGIDAADNKVNINSVSYQEGYNAGISAADNKVNINSASYQEGYSAGINAADNKVNTNSASYIEGYNQGRVEGIQNLSQIHLSGEFWTPYGGLQWLNIEVHKNDQGVWISTTSNNEVGVNLTQ